MCRKFIICLFFLSLYSFVYTSTKQENTESCSKSKTMENSCSLIDKEGVLPSARKCIGPYCENRCWGFIGKLDFLYFQPKEDGFEYVAKNFKKDRPTSEINVDSKVSSFDFSYEPGFKLALGFYIPRLSWDMFFNWTSLHSNHKNQVADDPNQGLIPLFWTPSAFDNVSSPVRFVKSHSKINFSFNSLELLVGDSFYTSPYVSLSLHGGLKGVVFDQKFKVYYENGSTFRSRTNKDTQLLSGQTNIKSDAKGLGPEIVLDSSWSICKSEFNLLASGGFAFLLTRFNMLQHEYDTALDITNVSLMAFDSKLHEYIWLLRPAGQLKLGMGWGTCFGCSKSYYLGINAFYEMQYYWEQNLSRKLVDNQVMGISYPNKGDVLLHGLVLSSRFEF